MKDQQLRAAIIGGGMIAQVHRHAIAASGAALNGVLGSSPGRGVEIAAAWGTESFDHLDALLQSDVDVIHICSPNNTHSEYAIAALRAGKHVVCEKPIATSVDEANRMLAVAEETGLIAAVPFVYRYHPLVREIRERRIQGEFGEWNALHGSYLQDWMLSPSVGNWRVDEHAGGHSRAFADIGSHWCDLVEWVSGETFTELVAAKSIVTSQRPGPSTQTFTAAANDAATVAVKTEDIASVLLRTANQTLGTVTVSQVAAGRRNRLWFELDGSKASAVFDQESPETAWIGRPEAATVIARDPGHGSAEQRRLAYLPSGHAQGYQDCFNAFVADTYAAIRGEEVDGLPTFVEGARSARLVDAVIASSSATAWTQI